jgi:hypothetical protein
MSTLPMMKITTPSKKKELSSILQQLGKLNWLSLGLFGGFLALFFRLHYPVYYGSPAMLPGDGEIYLHATRIINPFELIDLEFRTHALMGLHLELLAILALLFFCYIWVVQVVRRGMQLAGGLGTICSGVLLFSLPLLFLPYVLSSDVYQYIFYGRISALYGGDPGLTVPSAYPQDPFLAYVYWQDMPQKYGPVWTLFSYALTLVVEWLGGYLWLYVLAYKVAALAVHLLNTTFLWNILGRWKPSQQAWGTLLYAWNPLALVELVGNAHNDGLMLCLMLLGVWLALQGAFRTAIIMLVSATLVKWIAIVLLSLYGLVLISQQRTWSARLRLAGQVAIVTIVTTTLLYYWAGQAETALNWSAMLPISNMAANSFCNAVLRQAPHLFNTLGLSSSSQAVTQKAIFYGFAWLSKVSFALAWTMALAVTWRRSTLERCIQGCFWVFLITLLLTSWFWSWYVLWLLALAALLDWKPAGQVATAFTATAMLVYIDEHWILPFFVFLPIVGLVTYHFWQERILALRFVQCGFWRKTATQLGDRSATIPLKQDFIEQL